MSQYASALVKDGQVVGGMLATPDHPSHAPALTPEVQAQLKAAIDGLPHDGQIHVIEIYQSLHPNVRQGSIREGLHVNGQHMHVEQHVHETLVPDDPTS